MSGDPSARRPGDGPGIPVGRGGSDASGGPIRRRRKTLKIALAVAVVLAGFKLLSSGVSALSGPPSPSRGTLFGSWYGPPAAPLTRSVPLRVRVPSVGIDAPLIRLGLDADGAVAVPPMSVPSEA